MKTFTKAICLLLALGTLLSVPVSAAAMEEAGTYSMFFVGYGSYCWKTTGTQFQVWFDVTAQRNMDKLGVERIKIQKSADGENWLTVMTYNSSYYTYLLGEDTGFYSNHVTYTGASGYYYRAYLTFYAEDGTGIGKVYQHTQPIYLGG